MKLEHRKVYIRLAIFFKDCVPDQVVYVIYDGSILLTSTRRQVQEENMNGKQYPTLERSKRMSVNAASRITVHQKSKAPNPDQKLGNSRYIT